MTSLAAFEGRGIMSTRLLVAAVASSAVIVAVIGIGLYLNGDHARLAQHSAGWVW
jgi:hypothetical protein